MAKLEWFKFSPADWIMGRIMRMPAQVQADYVRLMCVYWNKGCELSFKDAKYEVQDLEMLVDAGIVKIDPDLPEMIRISFLDDQMNELTDLSEKRRKAAQSRWNSKARAKQKNASALQSDADKKRRDKNRADKKRTEQKRTEKKGREVKLPFESDEFSTMWEHWLEYKREEHGFKYKSAVSEQAALKKLVKLANGDETTALAIVMQSIENGWKGFFNLKKSDNGSEQKFNADKLHDFVNKG